MKKTSLQEHHPGLYIHLLLFTKLYPRLLKIDPVPNQRFAWLMAQMVKATGITEQLKATDQMKWLGLMDIAKA